MKRRQGSVAGKSEVKQIRCRKGVDREAAWKQVLAREPAADFFYAVTTTGVFCRPSCASRRPLKANVRFFKAAEEAQAAGFRACKKCKPEHCVRQPFGQNSHAH